MFKLQILAGVLCALSSFGQNSVLSSGQWYKFSVAADGVYRIDYPTLQKAGINPSQINPKNIRLYTGQPGMLPQPNSTARISDPVEIAITVVGEGDGKFDGGDYILFYAQGPDISGYDTKTNFFSYQKNLFSNKSYYFLTISSTAGQRLGTSPNIAGSFPVITQFDDFAIYENDLYNVLHSGRQWFGEQFNQSSSLSIRFAMPGIVPNSNVTLTSHVMAQSTKNCSFNVAMNNHALLTQPVAAWPNTDYGAKGVVQIDTIHFNEQTVQAAQQSNQLITYQFNQASPGMSIGYLDYVLFSTQRTLALYGNQTSFLSASSTTNTVSTFQVAGTTSSNIVWDISNPFHVKLQSTLFTNSAISFSASTDSLKKFVVFSPAQVPLPAFESALTNQNLHAITSADALIITYSAWLTQANRLASFRQSHNQLNAVVITTDAIFNEYSGSKPDVSAVRDFIRDVYKKSGGQLKYVTLFGRGSYDYKNRVYGNTNFVPIYESYNSLDPLGSYSSDDYFGFLEDSEGAWPENPAVNYSLDVGIGRLPVKTLAEAQGAVDKLIDYETNPKRLEPWSTQLLFMGDSGDANLHQSSADQLATSVDINYADFHSKRLLVDSYQAVTEPAGQRNPGATKALDLALRKGYAIVNYTGHGSEQLWSNEQILTPDLVQGLSNAPYYPLFVTATCDFGRNDDPSIISSGELLLLQKNGGGIGLITTARLVNAGTNFPLNQAFYQSLFIKNNNAFRPIGQIFRDTKNNSLAGINNRNFSLIGDPSMKLILPDNQVTVSQIKTLSGVDTVRALSNVTITGQIKSAGVPLTNFNGTGFATLYDKPQNLLTLGNPNNQVNPPSPVYAYQERNNTLFNGSFSVSQGAFQFNFIAPQEVVAAYGSGKVNLYAFSTTGVTAAGGFTNFIVGGVEPAPTPDTTPPTIKLFLSDSTFVNGGTVSANTQLYAQLFDESGINTASINPQKDIIATLDNKWQYLLNDYYTANKDNFRKGTVTYPLDTLKPGRHLLTLTASDTYGNTTSVSVNFTVAPGSGITVTNFMNYPNPFQSDQQTTFQFNHTRAGEDLEATLKIFDLYGHVVAAISYSVPASTYEVKLGIWNGENTDGTKFSAGIYVARVYVRSLADGSENEQSTKLIVLN
ncbi:MAG: type IX secretion system sortase PorU [Bacteroidetes bacterium]|nr:type IX secretion system sortase PorU [Bacteroidota bacterium]MBS1539584.1 type IX secretion system sortase PorU [Bacteroidota bacterium]